MESARANPSPTQLTITQPSADVIESESTGTQQHAYAHESELEDEPKQVIESELIPKGRRYPLRQRKVSFLYPYSQYVLLIDEGEPECYEEAMTYVHKEKWDSAMQDEMDSLHENHTNELIELPKGNKALLNKWVYKLKTGEDGSTPRY